MKHQASFAALLLLSSMPAYAYLDPATGSIIIQALLAGLVGALLAGKIFFAQIKSYFSRLFFFRKE